jgi:hypothetical protein
MDGENAHDLEKGTTSLLFCTSTVTGLVVVGCACLPEGLRDGRDVARGSSDRRC